MEWWLGAIIVYGVFLFALLFRSISRPVARRLGSGEYSSNPHRQIGSLAGVVKIWDVAFASSAMIPALAGYVSDGAVLYIIGSGGAYLSQTDSYYGSLLDWTKRFACTIHYILIDPNIDHMPTFLKLEDESAKAVADGKGKGRFKPHFLTPDDVENAELRNIVRRLRTYHPNILENEASSVKVMWLEGYHPVDSKIAYNVQLVDLIETPSPARLAQFVDIKAALLRVITEADELRKIKTVGPEKKTAGS
jgi:hypothetical protein